ncbi:MAG: response regulator [Nitrospirales bacterium]|nr:response regulator [Nitrospirales bacterium]
MTYPCHTDLPDRDDSSIGNPKRVCQILVVDDDAAMRSLLVDELQEQGCRIIEASDGKDALFQLQTFTPDLIITDLKMPDGGFEFFRKLQKSVPGCPIVLITAFGDSHTKAQAQECGVIAYMDKPVRIADLKASLTHICQMNPCKHSSPLTIL